MIQPFGNDPKQIVARGLQLGVDYLEQVDGTGYPHKFVNLENDRLCPREGIIELEAMRISNKHDNHNIIRRTKDRKSGLFWGIPSGINEETKQLQWLPIILENKKILDLSVPEQRREWLILKNSTAVEGSPNLFGRPYYKVVDKAQKAAENVNRRIIRQKAEAIVAKLSGKALDEAAVNLGVNLEANKNLSMLTDEVYRKMEENPAEFVKMMEDPQRPYVSILNRALSMGVVIFDNLLRSYKYGGVDLGDTKEAAIKSLVESNNMATAIDNRCNTQESESLDAMRMRRDDELEISSSYNEIEQLKQELADAKLKLENAGLVKEVEFKAPFADNTEIVPPTDQMEDLKARAKALKITGYNMMKEETLLSKIAEAESK